jgi:hypothetical protein
MLCVLLSAAVSLPPYLGDVDAGHVLHDCGELLHDLHHLARQLGRSHVSLACRHHRHALRLGQGRCDLGRNLGESTLQGEIMCCEAKLGALVRILQQVTYPTLTISGIKAI